MIHLYTDASVRSHGGAGIGIVISAPDYYREAAHIVDVVGIEHAEILAISVGLSFIDTPSVVQVTTDSQSALHTIKNQVISRPGVSATLKQITRHIEVQFQWVTRSANFSFQRSPHFRQAHKLARAVAMVEGRRIHFENIVKRRGQFRPKQLDRKLWRFRKRIRELLVLDEIQKLRDIRNLARAISQTSCPSEHLSVIVEELNDDKATMVEILRHTDSDILQRFSADIVPKDVIDRSLAELEDPIFRKQAERLR